MPGLIDELAKCKEQLARYKSGDVLKLKMYFVITWVMLRMRKMLVRMKTSLQPKNQTVMSTLRIKSLRYSDLTWSKKLIMKRYSEIRQRIMTLKCWNMHGITHIGMKRMIGTLTHMKGSMVLIWIGLVWMIVIGNRLDLFGFKCVCWTSYLY
ncbi:hypothetical protein HanXRQr2_Chr05g0219511 [Helianthus annuus]|uniref:Uncharacterized protein n=1 Tax=Helianthus annuus TaxID=4232 RepID=A0A9K3J0X0_HELAN|nr:hypothetical protein HanXRQr2_Chr05g0219511 [Helianthus annuus]